MKRALIEAKELLRIVTPLKRDCGELCKNACCDTDPDGQGTVTLFPGEEEELRDIAWGRVTSSGELVCQSPCERNIRPMGCMIFPLTPALKKDGSWSVRLDSRAKAMCPLYRCGIKGLDAEFVAAAKRAVEIMARDGEFSAFMREWYYGEREFRNECERLAGGKDA